MSDDLKCECPHCGGHIAFPVEMAGQMFECPHCKKETILCPPPTESNAETEIFVGINDEQRGPFARSQVLSMWNSGVITSDAIYWHEGMADWMPISLFIKKVSEPLPELKNETKAASQAASPKIVSGVNVSNLMELAKAAAEANNYQEAYAYYTKVLEYFPKNSEAWLGKGEAAGWASTVAEIKTKEMISAFENAINCATEEDKPVFRELCADKV